MAYSDKVIDHYENPRNVGSFGKEEKGVATGMVGAPACGDVMKLQIRVGKLRELSPLWEMIKDGVDLNSIQWTAH